MKLLTTIYNTTVSYSARTISNRFHFSKFYVFFHSFKKKQVEAWEKYESHDE